MSNPQPPSPSAVLILDAPAIERALRRVAHEIIERNPDLSQVVLAGIPSRGVEIAKRLIGFIEQIERVRLELGIVDASMHRDDIRMRRTIAPIQITQLPQELEGRTIILVDDVLMSGRTCRAAIDALLGFGRPDRIQLAVLVDRGHRELPIRADFVAKNLPTSLKERVLVRFENLDEVPDSVWLDKEARA
jgi:pyrimidine operon attenuation protein / uracil phosphoribosyltransferase